MVFICNFLKIFPLKKFQLIEQMGNLLNVRIIIFNYFFPKPILNRLLTSICISMFSKRIVVMKVRRNLNIIEKKNKKVIKWSSGEGGQ